MVDFYEYSTPELVKLLGNRFKELMRRDDKKVQRVRHSK